MSSTKNNPKQQKTITCKYIKKDKYKNNIFLVSNDNDELKSEYVKVRKYAKILSKKYEKLPIWIEKEKQFATIRFKKSSKMNKLKDLAIYEIEFEFYEAKSKGNAYCNMVISDIKLIREHDNGERLDIHSDIEISSSDEDEE